VGVLGARLEAAVCVRLLTFLFAQMAAPVSPYLRRADHYPLTERRYLTEELSFSSTDRVLMSCRYQPAELCAVVDGGLARWLPGLATC